MGNATSANNKLEERISMIASDLILKQNIKDMENLSNKDYCNKLLILTSDVLNKKLDKKDIEYLSYKINGNKIVEKKNKDRVGFMMTDKLEKYDIKDPEEKLAACKAIAKYYIKIANLWYAILSTLNPVLRYKTNNGENVDVKYGDNTNDELVNKNINPNVDPKLITSNFCSDRIELITSSIKPDIDDETKYILDTSKICNNEINNMSQEKGIPELIKLYLDEYDNKEGKYIRMSKENRNYYERDLESFYKEFTGKEKPTELKYFEDIKYDEYRKNDMCYKDKDVNEENNFKRNLTNYNVTSELYKSYGGALRNMLLNANNNKKNLISIIDILFVRNSDNEIIINPNLNEDKLDKLINKSRDIIVNLYINCEKDFRNITEIFSTIIKYQRPIENAIDNLRSSYENIDSAQDKLYGPNYI
tara:strand:- start:4708 stop:5964 length:1257 start_codon:yes stop_codon:yes gene_type:complete